MPGKQIFIFCVLYTSLCSLLIFIGSEIFFPSKIHDPEEQFINLSSPELILETHESDFASFDTMNQDKISSTVNKIIFEQYKNKFLDHNIPEIFFRYFPWSVKAKMQDSYSPLLEVFLKQKYIFPRISTLGIYMYENTSDVRWRMRAHTIHLYGALELGEEEFLSVFIHEFAHYFDIYTWWEQTDKTSQKFYDVSWKSLSVIRAWQSSNDFVSGYALTNQFEDYAESYLYFILHNEDFYQKSLNQISLARKYNFFAEEIFTDWQFQKTNFWGEASLKSYYWDITKLRVDIKNFLQYMQNGI